MMMMMMMMMIKNDDKIKIFKYKNRVHYQETSVNEPQKTVLQEE